MNLCDGQMSLVDLFASEKVFKAGDWIEKENVGEQLTFDEITQMIGQLIVLVGYKAKKIYTGVLRKTSQ